MKTAFSVWNERISPVFDASRHFLALDIEDGEVRARTEVEILDPNPFRKLETLIAMNVRALVCGAISRPLAQMAEAAGIETVAFIAGGQEEVIEAFLQGKLPTPALTMPGCCGLRPRSGRCCRQGNSSGQVVEAQKAQTNERNRTMPQGDGTGPLGKGPGTGKGMGRCGKGQQPGKQSGSQGQGQGRGQGRGQGQGRGSGGGKGNKQG